MSTLPYLTSEPPGVEYVYRIDAEDRIVETCGNWADFAERNSWSNPVAPTEVRGHSIWQFIQDKETRYLYREVFRLIRSGRSFAPIPFRCDAPEERRFFELRLKEAPESQIRLRTRVLRTEPRAEVKLLAENIPRSETFVTVCSMCKKMKLREDRWGEIEEGLTTLRIFEADRMPRLTHGLCNDCFHHTINCLEDSGNVD